MAGITYPVTTIPVPADVQAHTNELFQFDDEYLVQSDVRQDDFVRIFDRSGQQDIANKDHWLFQMNDIANNSWYCPSRSFLKINFKVRWANDGATPNPVISQEPCAFLSDLRGLFKRVRFGLGGQTITDISDYFWVYPGCDNAFWTEEYAKTIGSMMGCYPTRANQMGNEQQTAPILPVGLIDSGNNFIGASDKNNYQNAFGKRAYLLDHETRNAATSNSISVFIPLYHMTNVLQYFDKATSQLQWEIELWCHNNPNINVFTTPIGDSETVKANIEFSTAGGCNGIELWARRITPTETARLVLTEKMNRGLDMAIKFADLQIYKEVVPNGRVDPDGTLTPFDFRATVTASRPVYATILFQFPDMIETQEYEYDNFNTGFLADIQMLVNQVQVPTEGMTMVNNYSADYQNNGRRYPFIETQIESDVSRPYFEYLRQCGNYKAPYLTGFGAGAGTLTEQDWRNRCPAYCFDLSAREIGQWSGGASEIRVRGHIRTPPTNLAAQPSQLSGEYNVWTLLWTERTLGVHLQNWNSYVGVA